MVVAAVGTVLPPATCCGCTSAPRSASRRPSSWAMARHAHAVGAAGQRRASRRHPRRHHLRVDRLDADAGRHRRARRLPAVDVQDHRSRPSTNSPRCSGSSECSRRCSPLAASCRRRSTTTRSRPSSCWAPGICLVLMVDLFVAESKKWILATLVRLRAARRVAAGRDAWRDRERRHGRCSTTATWSTTSAWC